MTDKIADNFEILFQKDLFKENNFIKIYNLLGIHNNISDLASVKLEAEPKPKPVAPTPIVLNYKLFQKFNTIMPKDENKFNDSLNIFKDLHIKKQDKINILKTIINDNIILNYDKDTVILDPAGLNFMRGNISIDNVNNIEIKGNNTFGGSGLSGQIYNLFEPNNNNPKFIPQEILDFYEKKTYINLYNSPINVSIYHTYKDINNNDLNIIHSIGPDFSNKTPSDIYIDKYANDIEKLKKLFTDIYNDVLTKFTEQRDKNVNLKLRLCILSGNIFAGNYKYLIFNCIAYVYIKLWEQHKDYIKLYLYDVNGDNERIEEQNTYKYVTTIINNILE